MFAEVMYQIAVLYIEYQYHVWNMTHPQLKTTYCINPLMILSLSYHPFSSAVINEYYPIYGRVLSIVPQ